MALATRCPNCQALFRVAAEQLRSRGGMVRCGSCRKVFNAIAGLDYLDAQRLAEDDTGPRTRPTPPPTPTPPPPTLTAAPLPALSGAPVRSAATTPATLPPISAPASGARLPAAPVRGPDRPPVPAAAETTTRVAATPATAPAEATLPAAFTPLPSFAAGTAVPPTRPSAQRTPPAKTSGNDRRRNPRPETGTLSTGLPAGGAGAAASGFRVAAPAAEETPEGQGAAFDTLFIVPREESTAEQDGADGQVAAGLDAFESPSDGPSFLQDAPTSPLARAAMIAGVVVLLPLLVAQLALIFRTPLVVAFPAMRPALQTLCAPLSCTASWPMRPDLLAVVSSELQAVPGTSVLELDTVLRNRAAFPLALPAIELSISDNSGRAVARKVFLPAEYLGSLPDAGTDPAASSIAAGADLAVRVFFDLPGISATNFEAYPFYP